MYFFVRFTGVVILACGILLMLFGFVGAIYGFFQYPIVADLVNRYIFEASQSNLRVTDTRFYTSVAGPALFLLGMGTAAFGQVLLVFADIATNTRETKTLLRSLRRAEAAAARSAHTPDWDGIDFTPVLKQPAQPEPIQAAPVQTALSQPAPVAPTTPATPAAMPTFSAAPATRIKAPWETSEKPVDLSGNQPRG
jgi:hypothetical protein